MFISISRTQERDVDYTEMGGYSSSPGMNDVGNSYLPMSPGTDYRKT